MKICKRTAAVLATLALLSFQSTNVFAQVATTVCFSANITRVGSVGADIPNGNSGFRIEVNGGTCGFAAYTPFFIHSNLGNSGLNIALAAFALQKTVTLILPTSKAPNSLVYKIHIDE